VGIDPIRIIGATWKNADHGESEGGSTLTQQLAKNLFLPEEQTLRRKVNEWAFGAAEIERLLHQNQIMELYAITYSGGQRLWRSKQAPETYFGKPAKDLTMRSSLYSLVCQGSQRYSPLSNPARAKSGRDLVHDLMAKNGLLISPKLMRARRSLSS